MDTTRMWGRTTMHPDESIEITLYDSRISPLEVDR
jgi:hypothetical protein